MDARLEVEGLWTAPVALAASVAYTLGEWCSTEDAAND